MMEEMQDIEASVDQSLIEASRISDQIEERTGVAIRSLQFEDIVRQVGDHAEQRVFEIEKFISGLQEGLQTIAATGSYESIDQIRSRLNAAREHTNNVNKNPAEQGTMSEGNIEFF